MEKAVKQKKIVLVPLDERPCNMLFPERLFRNEHLHIVRPSALGKKKKPAERKALEEFLRKECKDADGLILSVDSLLYGGLIPSRLHHETKETLLSRMALIREIREENPNMLFYAFQVIMRCPAYSSSDEEPDYYENFGQEIHDGGVLLHKGESADALLEKIDKDCLKDYLDRRALNRAMNEEMLQYLKEGLVDALVIPQDDSASFGFAAMDQAAIRKKIAEEGLTEKVLVYPGADEVELTLISRMLNTMYGKCPGIFPYYLAEKAGETVPLYEGLPLSRTLSYHAQSAGCRLVEEAEEADIVLFLTASGEKMREAVVQGEGNSGFYTDRELCEWVIELRNFLKKGKIVSIADNAYANGGDLAVVRILDQEGLLMKVDGYAGWNTSANTIGTAIAEAVDALYYGENEAHRNFLLERYLEDAGYCGVVRKQVTDTLPSDMNYFDVKEERGFVAEEVRRRIKHFAESYLPSIANRIHITKLAMPWKRMFEVDLEAKYEVE